MGVWVFSDLLNKTLTEHLPWAGASVGAGDRQMAETDRRPPAGGGDKLGTMTLTPPDGDREFGGGDLKCGAQGTQSLRKESVSKGLKEAGEGSMWVSERRTFQAQGTTEQTS